MKVRFALLLVAIGLCDAPSAKAFDASAGGFGWLQTQAVRHSGWIHFHGPLYNYGPYYGGQGYQTMNVPYGIHNGYHPAYPLAVNGGYGYGVPSGPAPTISGGVSSRSNFGTRMPSEPANVVPNYLSAPAASSNR